MNEDELYILIALSINPWAESGRLYGSDDGAELVHLGYAKRPKKDGDEWTLTPAGRAAVKRALKAAQPLPTGKKAKRP